MRRRMWIAGITGFAAAGLTAALSFSACAAEPVPEGVYVGDVSLAGLSEKQAEEQIGRYAQDMLDRKVTLVVNGNGAEADADDLGMEWKNRDEVTEALHGARISGNLIRRYMKKKDLAADPVHLAPDMSVDQEKIAAFVSENCGTSVTEAVNASLSRENGKFVITPEVKGAVVNIEATERALNDALKQGGAETITVEAVMTESEPEITAETLSTVTDVLGTFSTDFSSSGSSRATNLQVGASKINGHILMPGETLSGYECMQPFTTANGYREATAYENGRSVDSIGGGVCQISTTLYNASLRAELEIVQRFNHSMTVAYVKPSMDAAIAGTYKDLKIKNPYDTPVYIEGYTSGRTLTFTVYGKETRPSNRKIEFESETLRRMDAGAPIEQVDPTLAPGQRIQVQSGHNGLQSRLFKCVYVDGELKERTLLHNDTYNASKAIYRVGPPAPETPETVPETAAPAPPDQIPETTAAIPPEYEKYGPGYNYGPGAPTETEAPSPGPGAPAGTAAPETAAPAPAEGPGAQGPGAPETPAPAEGPGA